MPQLTLTPKSMMFSNLSPDFGEASHKVLADVQFARAQFGLPIRSWISHLTSTAADNRWRFLVSLR
jgi:hypothetical protein